MGCVFDDWIRPLGQQRGLDELPYSAWEIRGGRRIGFSVSEGNAKMCEGLSGSV